MDETAIGELSRLIPEESRYSGVAPDVWIGGVGTYKLALGYSLIFWPRFVEFEGYVLREDFSLDLLSGYEDSGPRWTVEALVNHIHLGDLHDAYATGGQLRYLGRTLKEIYEVKLAHDFPDRRFTVEFNDACDRNGYLDADQLTFWQI